jgi:uncharacterized protein involved in exopolysaccharide biosynthesis
MSAFSDSSKSSKANPANRPFSRSDYETVPHSGDASRTTRDNVARDAVTLEKVGDFLELDFRRLFVWLRSGILIGLVLAVIGALAGAGYGLLAKSRFTVDTDILINPANLQVVNNDLYSQSAQVDGQVLNARSKQRVLTSGNVLAHVVDQLHLVDDLEFYDPTPKFSIAGLLGLAQPAAKANPRLAALESLSKRVSAVADDKSFVATLSVSAETPDKAITIANAIVKSFQDELAKAEADGAGRAATALEDRLGQLKNDAQIAEEKVEAFKRSHNLSSTNGQLVSSQTMTQLNTQIVAIQSRLIAAQAGYDAAVAAGANATGADPAAAAAMNALRDKGHSLQQQLDAQAMTYGKRHPTLVRLKAELSAVNGQLKLEVARTVQTAKATLDKAKASLAALNTQMDNLKGNVFSDNESQVAQRELERDAASKTTIYESFLARSQQIAEREQIDTTDVRVISSPVPPQARSWPPRTILLILLGGIAGLILGMLFALCRGIFRDLR